MTTGVVKEMSKISVLFFFAVLLLSAGAEANAQRPTKKGRAQGTGAVNKERDIRRLLEVTNVIQRERKSIGPLFEMYKQQAPQVPANVWDEIKKEIETEFTSEVIMSMYVPIYARHFSAAEIRQLLAFYESPVGRKWVAELEVMESELFLEGFVRGAALSDKIREKLKAKGFKLPDA